jgi:hypothetical protein
MYNCRRLTPAPLRDLDMELHRDGRSTATSLSACDVVAHPVRSHMPARAVLVFEGWTPP